MTTDATDTRTAENGVNVAALLGAREALSRAPEAARFKWRAPYLASIPRSRINPFAAAEVLNTKDRSAEVAKIRCCTCWSSMSKFRRSSSSPSG